MRIPAHRIWRAFPELDAFADEDCRLFVRRARREHRALVWLVPPIVWIVAFITIFTMLGVLVASVRLPATPKWLSPEARDALVSAMVIGALVGGSSMFAMLARDVLVRRLLRGQINKARCTRCQFSLLGLRVHQGTVRCPECGTDVVLAQIGLCAEDLIAVPASPDPT